MRRAASPCGMPRSSQSLYGADGGEADKRINEAVAALFTKYPG